MTDQTEQTNTLSPSEVLATEITSLKDATKFTALLEFMHEEFLAFAGTVTKEEATKSLYATHMTQVPTTLLARIAINYVADIVHTDADYLDYDNTVDFQVLAFFLNTMRRSVTHMIECGNELLAEEEAAAETDNIH